jgi:hypothetical protein
MKKLTMRAFLSATKKGLTKPASRDCPGYLRTPIPNTKQDFYSPAYLLSCTVAVNCS